MCEHYKYMLQVKPEFDIKFKKTGIRSQMVYLCEVEDVKKGIYHLHYDKERFNLLVKECGKCRICRFKKASIKAAQAQCEYKSVGKGSFVTFTFGEKQLKEYISKNKRYSNMSTYMKHKYINYLQWSLEKREFQLFMKRLRQKCFEQDLLSFSIQKGYTDNYLTNNGKFRKKIIKCSYYDYSDFKPRKIRFMHCGEYGECKNRPHHHAIIFGINFAWDKNAVRYSWKRQRNVVVHFNNMLNDLWPFGDVTTDNVSYQTCNYVARYITKKVTNRNNDVNCPDLEGLVYRGRLPEYCTQSNRHGLGFDYYIKNAKKVNSDLEIFFKNTNGEIKSVPIPRYFKELMRRYYKTDYLRMMKLSLQAQTEFSNTPIDNLYSRMLDDRKKSLSRNNYTTGNFEKSVMSFDKLRYIEFELKKRVFDTHLPLFLSYKDSDFFSRVSRRVELYNQFERLRKIKYRKAINSYAIAKYKQPNADNLTLHLYNYISDLKKISNPFKSDKYLRSVNSDDIRVLFDSIGECYEPCNS